MIELPSSSKSSAEKSRSCVHGINSGDSAVDFCVFRTGSGESSRAI